MAVQGRGSSPLELFWGVSGPKTRHPKAQTPESFNPKSENPKPKSRQRVRRSGVEKLPVKGNKQARGRRPTPNYSPEEFRDGKEVVQGFYKDVNPWATCETLQDTEFPTNFRAQNLSLIPNLQTMEDKAENHGSIVFRRLLLPALLLG